VPLRCGNMKSASRQREGTRAAVLHLEVTDEYEPALLVRQCPLSTVLSCRYSTAYEPGQAVSGDNDQMADLYHDTWITCTDDAIVIRWYYLWGAKRIPYAAIRSAQRVDLGTFRGSLRIWGTANPRYWASLDPSRPGKSAALILDVGTPVRPFITPVDVPAVESVLVEHAHLASVPYAGAGPYL